METKVLQPADRMTTAQCVMECSGYLRKIANQEFEGEDWQTAPKLRRQNLLTDFLCNLELSGEEFAELCGLIGFQLSKTTTAKLAKFTVIAYDWQSEANGEATADILAALNKCEGVTLIEQRGYRPQARTYDYLRFHIAAFWRCLVNELRSLCLGVGLVVYPKEIPATPTETPRIVRVEIVRDFDKSYYANLYGENGGCHNLSKEYTDFRTLKTLCKKEYGVNLPNLSQIEFETHGRKSYAYISTETPQISTETAEAVNVSMEDEKETERAENAPKRKIQYFHYTPEQLKRYIIDVYEKNANGEWVLQPYRQIDTDKCFWNVINGKIGEWDRMQEKFIEVNMDFNSPTCGRCFKINRTYQQDYFIVSNEKLLEFTINGNYYYIQKQTYSKGKHRWCYTIMDAYGDFAVDDFSYTKRGIMQRFNKWWKKNATIIWQASETPTEPPQSPETPQTVECTTDTPKPRETARKRQKRAIGSTRTTQRDTLRDTLRLVTYVPRECSTADAAYRQPRPNSLLVASNEFQNISVI